ncbi:MAG: hypothetical protein ACRD32_08375, partial [Nitrososphaerales archaeon]
TLDYAASGNVQLIVVIADSTSTTLDKSGDPGTNVFNVTFEPDIGINSITFSTIPGGTIGIKNIVTKVATTDLENISLDGVAGGAVVPIGSGGIFGPNALVTNAQAYSVTATFGGNDDYIGSSADTGLSIELGAFGAGTGVSYNGKIFSPYVCGQATLPFVGYPADDIDGNGNPDNDGDYICDRWEASSLTYPGVVGIPFQIFDYSPGGTTQIKYFPLAPAAEAGQIGSADVYVEQDWFRTAAGSTHKLRADAVDAVKAVFLTHGIYLHVIDSDSMLEPATNNFVTVFTDTNTIYGDDFNTIKSKLFADVADRLAISFFDPAAPATAKTDVTVSAPSTCTGEAVTVTLRGINISTPTNTFGDDVSGTVT